MESIAEQIEIHFLAQFLYSRSGANGIVALTEEPGLLAGQYPANIKLFVVCPPLRLRRYRKKFSRLLPGCDFITARALNEKFLSDKQLVCINYLDKSGGGRRLRRLLPAALLGIVAIERHADRRPAMNLKAVRSMLANNRTLLSGVTRYLPSSAAKDCLVAIDGRLSDVRRDSFPLLSVLAIVPAYNERDIIAATIKHLLDQGVDVHVIDNWSTDGSYEIVQALAAESPRVSYERFPEKATGKYEWGRILARVARVAKTRKAYQWITLNDADELRWSPWRGVTLQEAFSFIDSRGYDAVDYTVFNFAPTEEGFSEKDDPLSFFKYGEFSGIAGHFVQVKSWRNNPQAELAASGGHHVAFPGQKIFPLKFFLGHYPLRSTSQAREKIFKDRQPRYTASEKKKGWHVHYDGTDKEVSFVRDKKELVDFSASDFAETYILERLSGIGVKRESNE